MICSSYDQLTIVEKTQFIGKLMHLVQSKENAFLAAEKLITSADAEGLFKNVTILPATHIEPASQLEVVKEYIPQSLSYEFPDTHQSPDNANLVVNLYHRTKESLQRSYHKLFARLAS